MTDNDPAAAGDGDGFSIDQLNELIDARANEMFAQRSAELAAAGTPPAGGKAGPPPTPGSPPSPPAAGQGPLDPSALQAAVERALQGRDDRDRVMILEDELTKLKAELAGKAGGGRVKRNWASVLLGMGSGRY